MTPGGIPVGVSADPFTAGSLAKPAWFLRDRIRDAIAAGHPHAEQLQDSVEDAVLGILDYIDHPDSHVTPGNGALPGTTPARYTTAH